MGVISVNVSVTVTEGHEAINKWHSRTSIPRSAVACLLACRETTSPPTHPRKLSRIGVAHPLQPCDDMFFFLCSCTAQSTIVLLLERPFFHAPCASTRQSLDRPYFYF